jgi:hypothetical protein
MCEKLPAYWRGLLFTSEDEQPGEDIWVVTVDQDAG